MANVGEWIKQHKAAVAIGVAGIVGILLLRRSSASAASSSGTGDGLQIAQLQAQQNLAQANVQAQQNEAVIGAQAQVDQTNAELQGQQNELAVGLAQNLNSTGTQASLLQEELDQQGTQQSAYDSLVENLGPEALSTSTMGGKVNSETGLNELALLLNEGNSSDVSAFDSGTAQESVAGTVGLDELLASLEGPATSLLGGL
jgi:GH24 family phage-related lysozyme (muramidase)